jgi:hypothetical protein
MNLRLAIRLNLGITNRLNLEITNRLNLGITIRKNFRPAKSKSLWLLTRLDSGLEK